MIWILGAGAFGTGLAISLAQNGPVTLWARDAAQAQAMQIARQNTARLPGFTLPNSVTVTADLGRLPEDAPCLLCVPTQKLRSLLVDNADAFARKPLIACCKGIELSTGLGPAGIIKEVVPMAQVAILTGPSFATDIARGLPTALTLACTDATTGARLQAQLSTPNLRIYRSTDVVGAELGGALKNVIAIACGAVMGADLGESARAALMTRGFAEMQRIAAAMGAAPETLSGLSGFGDLVLTCGSEQSRNYRYGLSLGRATPFDTSITVEGVATAQAMLDLAQKLGIDTPITRVVTALASRKLHMAEATDMLLKRPLKEE